MPSAGSAASSSACEADGGRAARRRLAGRLAALGRPVRNSGAMARFVLQLCGVIAVVIAAARSYAVSREAISPLMHDGDPTRTAIEATRRLTDRPRIRLFARRLAVAIGWLAVAMYGLFLIVESQVAA